MNITSPQIENLHNAARSIFDGYALSPDDRDEAVSRYVKAAGDGSFDEEKRVESILYSMYCENVWRRNSGTTV
jgi:hypothetical protein